MNSSTNKQEEIYRRTIRVLMGSQLMAGAGLAAGIAVGALLAEEMTGSTGAAGLPAALFILGSAAAAGLVGRLSQGYGRGGRGGGGLLFWAQRGARVGFF